MQAVTKNVKKNTFLALTLGAISHFKWLTVYLSAHTNTKLHFLFNIMIHSLLT